jgi:hypothetical protein
VTSLFRSLSSTLPLGALVRQEEFTMHEALAALQVCVGGGVLLTMTIYLAPLLVLLVCSRTRTRTHTRTHTHTHTHIRTFG